MRIKKYKIPTWFITENLHHKVGIHYEQETKRAYELLDIMSSKYFKIDRRKKLNQIEVTEEEYQTWYVYFLEYYIDDESIYAGTQDYKEAKKLLNKMIKFFGVPNFNVNHRAGTKMRFVRTLFETGVAQKIIKGNDTIN